MYMQYCTVLYMYSAGIGVKPVLSDECRYRLHRYKVGSFALIRFWY